MEEGRCRATPLPTPPLPSRHPTRIEGEPVLSATAKSSSDQRNVIDGPAGGEKSAMADPNVMAPISAKWSKPRRPWGTVYWADKSSVPLQVYTQAGHDDQLAWAEGMIPADLHQVNLKTMEEDLRRTVTSHDEWKSEYIRPRSFLYRKRVKLREMKTWHLCGGIWQRRQWEPQLCLMLRNTCSCDR